MLNNGELMIFWGCTPNKGTYIIPQTQVNEDIIKDIWGDKYQEYLASNFPHETFNINAYKLYNGYLDVEKLSYQYPYQSISPYKFTYIAIKISGKTLFYFVNQVEVMPQRVRLYIELDNWGTYIGGATIKNINVVNTNIQLNAVDNRFEPKYILPELANANQEAETIISAYGNEQRLSNADLIIVATIKYTKYSDYKDVIEVIENFAFNVRWLAGLGETATVSNSDLKRAVDWVQSIYSCQIPENLGTKEQTAQVINIYLLPNDYYNVPYDNNLATLEFNGIRNNGTSKPNYALSQNPGFSVGDRRIYEKEIVVGNGITYIPKTENINVVNINALGYNIYFGTLDNGIEMPIFAGCMGCKFGIYNQGDSMLIKVSCDNKEIDLTESFKVAGIANTESLTYQQTVAKALGGMANIAGGIFHIKAGGLGLVSGTSAIANQLVSGIDQKGGANRISGGNGYLTMRNVGSGVPNSPKGDFLYFVIKGTSNTVEQGKVYLNNYGATCNYPISDNYNFFTYINACPLLSANEASIEVIKIIQCSCNIDGIPYNAAEEIQAKLNEGVRLKAISINV